MNIILEHLTQILAKAGISSSQEKEVLIAAKRFTTPPEVTEELTFEESCILDKEHLFKLEIEREEEGISGDQNHEEYHANESCIKQWFQISIRLDRFCFHFYFINSHFQHLIFYIIVHPRIHFTKLNENICLLLLHRWLHWQFHYT